MAPELLAGKPASARSDLYSLGVVLYQLLVGDLSRPVTIDWTKDIADPLLRDDLQHCFAGKPEDRFVGAGQLAKHLQALPERQAELERREAERVALERAAYRRGVMRTAGVAGLIVVLITGLAIVSLIQSKRAQAEAARAAQAALAEKQERLRAEAGERLKFHTKGQGNGYVVTLGGRRIYLSGDTEDIPEMLALRNIDVAFVCMNLPYTMTVEQAARAVRAFKPRVVYPYHYRGSDLNRFKELVGTDAEIEVRLRDWYPKAPNR
jgi:serine/threonine protein kinase